MTFPNINRVFFINLNSLLSRVGIIITLLIVTSIAFISLFVLSFKEAGKRYEEVISNSLPAEKLCSQIEVYLAKSVGALDNFLLTGDNDFKMKRDVIWNGHIPAALNKLLYYTQQWENKNAVSYVYDLEIKANRIKAEENLVEKTYPSIYNLTYEKIAERKVAINRLDILSDEVLLLLDRLIKIKDEEIALAREQYIQVYQRLIVLSILGAFILIFIGIVSIKKYKSFLEKRIKTLSRTLHKIASGEPSEKLETQNDELKPLRSSINNIVDEMRMLCKFISEASKGNYNMDDVVFNKYGKLGDAADSLKKNLNKVADDIQTRAWITDGIGHFSDILRENSEDITSLSEAIITNLVKYLDAVQGAVYLLERNYAGDALVLKAKYAYDNLRYQEGKIKVGEGLLGEAFREKRMVYLERIPKDYLHITSGLGDGKPQTLLIMQLTANDNTNGMLEISSFHKLKDFQIEFVQKLCESISSTIMHTENSIRTKELLIEANENAEKLQAQEEEMRQNMEELLATQEELNRQKKETESYLEAFQNSYNFEINTDGYVINMSDALRLEVGMLKTEVTGKHISKFFQHFNLSKIIENIKDESVYIDRFEFLNTERKLIYLKVHFLPVQGNQNELASILCYCFDISDEVNQIETGISKSKMMLRDHQDIVQKMEVRIEKMRKRSEHNEALLKEHIKKLEGK